MNPDARQRDSDHWVDDPEHISLKVKVGLREAIKYLPKHGSFLDAGCGKGYVYDWLLKYRHDYFDYTGMDVDEREIGRARAFHEFENRYFCKDLYQLTPADGSWDVVFCARVLVHLLDPEEALHRLWSVTRKALVLVVILSDQDEEPRIVMHGEESWVYVRSFSLETLKRWATELRATFYYINKRTATNVVGVYLRDGTVQS